jgi:hypothetical protein
MTQESSKLPHYEDEGIQHLLGTNLKSEEGLKEAKNRLMSSYLLTGASRTADGALPLASMWYRNYSCSAFPVKRNFSLEFLVGVYTTKLSPREKNISVR